MASEAFDAGSKQCICGGHGEFRSVAMLGPTVIITYRCVKCGEKWEVYYSLHHVRGVGKG